MTDRQTAHAPGCWSWGPKHYECAVGQIERLQAEVKQLQADLAESDEIREKLGHLLTRTAAALKGEPPAGVWHSWHDLPEKAALAARLADVAEGLLDALRQIAEWPDGGNRYGQENIKRFAQATIDAAIQRTSGGDHD